MPIIYSYPLVTALEPEDTFIISKTYEDDNRIETKSIKFEDLQKSITDRFINPDATDFKIPVFNQGGTRITGSIMSQDSSPSNGVAGTKLTIAGDLTLERDQSDTTLTLISDGSNTTPGGEQHNPSIKFIQDGGSQNAAVGFNIIDDTSGGAGPGLGNRFWIVNSMASTPVGEGGITFGTAQVDGWENAIGRFIIRGDGKGLFGHPDSLYNKTLGSQFEIYDNRDENTTTDSSFSVYSVVDYAAPSGNEGAGGIKQILDVYDNGVFQQQEAMMLIPGTSASDLAASTPIAFYTNSNMDTASPSGFAGMIFDSGNWLLDGSGTFTATDPGYQLKVAGTGLFTDQVTIPETPVAGTDAASKAYVDLQNTGQVSGSGTVNTIPLWSTTTALSDSVLSQTTPYIGTNTGIVNINGTLKQSGTRKSIYIGENVGQSVNPASALLDIYNIGIGDDVLKDFTFGVVGANPEDPGDNVGIGYQALTGLLTGTNNVAIGTETLKTLTLGGNNIALGKNSLLALTGNRADSIGNVALGFNTLSSMTTGTFNVAIGNTNFEAITSANSIVSIGNDVAKPFTGSASNLVMIGNKVLANTTATSISDGILIGQNSGLATSGTVTNDILIGRSVFQNNDSGGNNIAIGGNANQNVSGTVSTSIALTTRSGPGTGGNASSYGIVISTYDSADVGVGSVNESTGKYSATIGGIGNLNQGGNGFIGGGKTNTIVSTATNSAILGGFDNEVQSGGSGGMAIGSNLQVNGNNQVVLGRFNTPNNNSKLIVGAGFSNANRINAFEVKNTSQLKLGKYGQIPANFPATSSTVGNVLVVGAANNVTEIPLSNAAFNSQLLPPGTRFVTAGSTTSLSASEEKIVKISWTGTTGNAILRLPLASNFVNKTIRFITDSSFPATATAQITGSSGTETINGSTAGVTLTGTYQATMVWSDGTEWWVL